MQIDAASFYSYELEVDTEKIHSLEGDSPASIKQYTLDYAVPRYSVTALNEASSEENIAVNNELINRYTQLPEDLPLRIQDLAKEITDGKDSWFEKARELERYFSRSGYIYDQKDVAIPADDEDYEQLREFHFPSPGIHDNIQAHEMAYDRLAPLLQEHPQEHLLRSLRYG